MNVRLNIVSVFVIRPGDSGHEVLQLHRSPGQLMGGTWQNVSGKVEDGEKAWQAAVREMQEETGLTPIELYVIEAVNSFYIWQTDTLFHSVQFCALVAPGAQIRLDHESDDFRWLSLQEAHKHFMWPGEHHALEQLQQQILDNSPAKPYLRVTI